MCAVHWDEFDICYNTVAMVSRKCGDYTDE